MIYTERTIRISKDKAKINAAIVLYRGDRDVEIIFTIVNSNYKFKSAQNSANVIESTQASYGQLAILNPNGENIISEVTKCQDGMVIFKITGDMIDEIDEVGLYSFHIRLYNEDQTSRVTLPPIIDGIDLREPLAI